MADPMPTADPESVSLADRAVELARRWVIEAAAADVDPAAERLAGVLQDANGLPFTLGFVDGVMRPESLSAAASQLHRIAPIERKSTTSEPQSPYVMPDAFSSL